MESAGGKVTEATEGTVSHGGNRITGEVIAAAIEVHRILGPGLLESTYMPCLQYELAARKLRFVTQQPLRLVYKGMVLDASYRLDLVVEDVVVEVKSVAKLDAVHDAQLLTYLNRVVVQPDS